MIATLVVGGRREEGKKKEVWEKGGGQGCLTRSVTAFLFAAGGHSHF